MKIQWPKYALLLLIMAFFSNVSSAQTPSTWVTITTVDNVKVSYKLDQCQGQEKLFLKIENANSSTKTVSWNLWNGTSMKTLSLPANATLEGSCNVNSLVELDEVIPEGKTLSQINSNVTVN